MKEIKREVAKVEESVVQTKEEVKADISLKVNGVSYKFKLPAPDVFLKSETSTFGDKRNYLADLIVEGDIEKLANEAPLALQKIVDAIFKKFGSESQVVDNKIIVPSGEEIILKAPTFTQFDALETFKQKSPERITEHVVRFVLESTVSGQELYNKYPAAIFLAVSQLRKLAGAEVEIDFLD